MRAVGADCLVGIPRGSTPLRILGVENCKFSLTVSVSYATERGLPRTTNHMSEKLTMTTTTTTEVAKPTIKLDSYLVSIMKKREEAGPEALKKHIAALAVAYCVDAEVVEQAYQNFLKEEKAKAEAEARAKRIAAKKAKVDDWVAANLKPFTVPKSVIKLLVDARDFSKTLCDEDSQVNLQPMFIVNENGEPSVTFTVSGLNASGGSTSTRSSDGTTSEKSRISPWAAWQQGAQKGDTFIIERLGPGVFRDATRNEDIPSKGLTKWIGTHYPDSQTAAILRKYGQL